MEKNKQPDLEIEMIHSFMEDMNNKQLEKLCAYAAKLLSDKRYKIKIDKNDIISKKQTE